LTIRDLKTLHSVTQKTTEEKRSVVDGKNRANADRLSLLLLSDEINPTTISEDGVIRTRIQESLQNLRTHENVVDSRLDRVNEEQSKVRGEANSHLSKANAILDKVRKTRLSHTERSSFDRIGSEQIENRKKAREILESVKDESPGFGMMVEYAKKYYDRAEIVSDSFFDGNDARNFTGHTLRHIFEVRGKMQDMLSSMQNVGFSESDFFSSETMDAAAAFHDTGMDANLSTRFEPWFMRAFKGNMPEMGADEKPRAKHAVSSALRILNHRDDLSAMGVNVDQAAFLINLHSKTGYLEGEKRDLSRSDFKDIKLAAENFRTVCKRMDVAWDDSWLYKEDGTPDEEVLRKTALSASILRLADANRDGLNLYAQKGVGYSFANKEVCKGRDPILDEKEMYREIEGMSIAYDYGDHHEELRLDSETATGKQIAEMNRTRAIVFGESNVDLMETGAAKGGKLIYRFTVNDPEIGIGCTAHAIQERLDEIKYSVFSNLEAFGGKLSDCVIEVVSDNGSVKKIVDCLNFPQSWHLVYSE
jgi:hypothetical protein